MYPDISKLRVESIGGRGGSSDAAKILQNHSLILKFDQNKAKSILRKVYCEQMWPVTSPSKAHNIIL